MIINTREKLKNDKAIINWDDLSASAGNSVREMMEDFSFGNETVVAVQSSRRVSLKSFPSLKLLVNLTEFLLSADSKTISIGRES